ncbi:MAG: glutathione S-transferase family protein [Actinomycetota bacterium]|jgi:glutathione S-transferase|nr:glutathione S-transferase family protein [Actinomycetota bacterium]MDQ3567541.1 glutathione S-transferase family protein [Actinomycetota bacterium]
MTLRLHDYLPSGNGYKVRLLLAQLGIPFERIEYDIARGETRAPDFLGKINPNGRIPVLETDGGEFLPESNAILFYLAEGTPFLPEGRLGRARVLQWMFFEQYSHEPNIAVARAWVHLFDVEMTEERRVALERRRKLGYDALGVMEGYLENEDFFAGGRYSIADTALYAYTHVAGEGGFDLAGYPAIRAWIERVGSQPGYVPITQG